MKKLIFTLLLSLPSFAFAGLRSDTLSLSKTGSGFGSQSSTWSVTMNTNSFAPNTEVRHVSDSTTGGVTYSAYGVLGDYTNWEVNPRDSSSGYNFGIFNSLFPASVAQFGMAREGYAVIRSSGSYFSINNPLSLGSVFSVVVSTTFSVGNKVILVSRDNADFSKSDLFWVNGKGEVVATSSITAPTARFGALAVSQNGVFSTLTSTSAFLVLRSINGTYGPVSLTLENEGGANGAIFEMEVDDIPIDFGFRVHDSVLGLLQSNLRVEARDGDVYTGNSQKPEMQFGPAGDPSFVAGNYAVGARRPFVLPTWFSMLGESHDFFVDAKGTQGTEVASNDSTNKPIDGVTDGGYVFIVDVDDNRIFSFRSTSLGGITSVGYVATFRKPLRIVADGRYLYVFESDQDGGGYIEKFDKSDPGAMVSVGVSGAAFDPGVSDFPFVGMDVSGEFLYLADNSLYIFDKNSLATLGNVGAGSEQAIRGVKVKGQTAFCITATELIAFNVTYATNPVQTAGGVATAYSPQDFDVGDSYAYIATTNNDGTNTIETVDITNPDAMINVSDDENRTLFQDVVERVTVRNRQLYAVYSSTVSNCSLSNVGTTPVRWSYEGDATVRFAAVDGNFVYTGRGNDSGHISKISSGGAAIAQLEVGDLVADTIRGFKDAKFNKLHVTGGADIGHSLIVDGPLRADTVAAQAIIFPNGTVQVSSAPTTLPASAITTGNTAPDVVVSSLTSAALGNAFFNVGGYAPVLSAGTTFFTFTPGTNITLKRLTANITIAGTGGGGDSWKCGTSDAIGARFSAVTTAAAAAGATATSGFGSVNVNSGTSVKCWINSTASPLPAGNVAIEYQIR